MPETVVLKDEPEGTSLDSPAQLSGEEGYFDAPAKETMKKLTQELQEINNQNQQYQSSSAQQGRQFGLPCTSVLERSDNSSDYRRKSDEYILRGRDVTNISRDTFKQEQSEGHSPDLHCNLHPVHSFSVGSLVEVPVGEKNVCGTVRWTGTFPRVKEPIAGVEVVSNALTVDIKYEIQLCMYVCM